MQVTVHNPENQSYLIAYKDSSLIISSAKWVNFQFIINLISAVNLTNTCAPPPPPSSELVLKTQRSDYSCESRELISCQEQIDSNSQHVWLSCAQNAFISGFVASFPASDLLSVTAVTFDLSLSLSLGCCQIRSLRRTKGCKCSVCLRVLLFVTFLWVH